MHDPGESHCTVEVTAEELIGALESAFHDRLEREIEKMEKEQEGEDYAED